MAAPVSTSEICLVARKGTSNGFKNQIAQFFFMNPVQKTHLRIRFNLFFSCIVHNSYMDLKHAVPRPTRAKLAKLLFELVVMPGMDTALVEIWANACVRLIK